LENQIAVQGPGLLIDLTDRFKCSFEVVFRSEFVERSERGSDLDNRSRVKRDAALMICNDR